MTICSCLYPLHIVDNRNSEGAGDSIEYLAIPHEVIDEMGKKINIPSIEVIKEEGFDGVKRDYVKVGWADSSGAMTKRYDINNHIMVIGCDSPKCKISGKSGSKHKNRSECKCDEKEVYAVLHPLDEWRSHHIVEINSISHK